MIVSLKRKVDKKSYALCLEYVYQTCTTGLVLLGKADKHTFLSFCEKQLRKLKNDLNFI